MREDDHGIGMFDALDGRGDPGEHTLPEGVLVHLLGEMTGFDAIERSTELGAGILDGDVTAEISVVLGEAFVGLEGQAEFGGGDGTGLYGTQLRARHRAGDGEPGQGRGHSSGLLVPEFGEWGIGRIVRTLWKRVAYQNELHRPT